MLTPTTSYASSAASSASSDMNLCASGISLVLATVGRTQELGRLFESFAAQTFRNFELVIVDQNTDDRLLEHIERARYLGINVRHLKHHPPNLAAARNAGIEAAKGKWIGFPDDDCWYDRHLLARIAERFLGDDKPSAVVAHWIEQGEQPPVACTLTWERARAFRDVPVSSITLFCDRELFKRIGGFDVRFGVGQWYGAAEETDFVFRALRSGALFAYDPMAEVHHAVGPQRNPAGPAGYKLTRHRARGTGALYAKHRLPLWVIGRGLTAPVLRPLLRGALGSEFRHGCALVRGRIDGWIGWMRQT